MKKLLTSYIKYKLSHLVAGRKNYQDWKLKNYSLRTAVIKNKKLAKELENACKESGGFLTYSEYLLIDQFGDNGYHATHKYHGITPTHILWGKTIETLCRKEGFTNVIDFGSAEGHLGIEMLKEAKKTGTNILWSGIEINELLREKCRKKFKKNNFEKNLKNLTPSIKEINMDQKSIAVFSYSMDSVPPDIFINTEGKRSFPNAIIGITVENNVLKEIVLTNDLLKTKNISFKDGIYTNPSGKRFDLTSWELYKNQRAYIPLLSFSILSDFADKIPKGSVMIIIDEFQPNPRKWETNHLCFPRDLCAYSRNCEDLENAYKTSGENLLYYTSYLDIYLKVLSSLGFEDSKYKSESKLMEEIIGKTFKKPGLHKEFTLCYAILTFPKRKAAEKTIIIKNPYNHN